MKADMLNLAERYSKVRAGCPIFSGMDAKAGVAVRCFLRAKSVHLAKHEIL